MLLLGNLPAPVRQLLRQMLSATAGLRVVPGPPEPGQLAELAARHRPALVIVGEADLPELAALARCYPVPVLLYADVPPLSSRLKILAHWHVRDYFGPAVAPAHPAFATWQAEVVRRIRAVAAPPARPAAPAVLLAALPTSVVVLGGSTGGSVAMEEVLRHLQPPLTCAVLVAVHLPRHFTQALVERLQRATLLPVVAGATGLPLTPGQVLVAPGGGHMSVTAGPASPWVRWQVACEPGRSAGLGTDSPSIDRLMQSAAQTTGRPTLGVVLSGLGRDGTRGARCIRQAGGEVVAQSSASAAVPSMPAAVVRAGLADAVLAPPEIGAYVQQFARRAAGRPAFFSSYALPA